MAQRAATKDIPMCNPPPPLGLFSPLHKKLRTQLNNHQLYPYWLKHTPACWTILPSMASLDGWLTTINQPPHPSSLRLHTIQKAPESPLEMARADSGLLCLLHQYKGGLPLQNSASTNQPKLRSQLSDIINSSRKKTKMLQCVSKTSNSC